MRVNQKLEGKLSVLIERTRTNGTLSLTDIQMSDWALTSSESNCLARNMSYVKPLNGSIGPRSTKCEVHDETVHSDLDDYISMFTTMRTPDVPTGSVCSVKTRTCITWASCASLRVVVSIQVEWMGPSFVKGTLKTNS